MEKIIYDNSNSYLYSDFANHCLQITSTLKRFHATAFLLTEIRPVTTGCKY